MTHLVLKTLKIHDNKTTLPFVQKDRNKLSPPPPEKDTYSKVLSSWSLTIITEFYTRLPKLLHNLYLTNTKEDSHKDDWDD